MQITTTEMVQGPLRAIQHYDQDEKDYSKNSKQQFTTQYQLP